MINIIFVIYVAVLVLYVALTICLAALYRRSKDRAFLWLLFALVVWPLIDNTTGLVSRKLLLRILDRGYVPVLSPLLKEVGWSPGDFTVVFRGLKDLIQVLLVLIGFWYLRRATYGKIPRHTLAGRTSTRRPQQCVEEHKDEGP